MQEKAQYLLDFFDKLKDEASASSFLFEGIGKNVRNESTEPKTPSKTAVEACPTAYKGTPRGEVGS